MSSGSPRAHFHFLTLFPETIRIWLTSSIVGRAHEQGLFAFTTHQLRDYSTDRHRTVDDSAYGGGGGMVLRIEPLVAAVEAIRAQCGHDPLRVVYFSPLGQRMDQALIDELVPSAGTSGNFLFICGHYEGVDQRFLDGWVDQEISLGDFVLTGGELPAVALADALIRQLEGALGYEEASRTESFALRDPQTQAPLLEYPHYTRPMEFRGNRVPDILLSGDHGRIADWRLEQARERTRARRPDLVPPKRK